MALSVLDGQPLSGVTVRIGSRTAVSGPDGAFALTDVGSGSQDTILSGGSIVERRTLVTAPSANMRAALIPLAFDLTAFDQMFRTSNDHLQRWTRQPSLVVITTVMNFTNSVGVQDEYSATSEQLTDAETELLIDQLTEALGLLSGHTFTSFASIERESAPAGAKVKTLRQGKIVVGRYTNVQGILNTIGFGRWATETTGEVVGGSIYLDRDFDKSNDLRRLLRTHELGHALGYSHVTSRTSVMNPAIGPEPTTFDRQAAAVAFQRPPGNQSPDTDPGTKSGGGIFGLAPGSSRVIWSEPIVCGSS
jgi:hypothetical protein